MFTSHSKNLQLLICGMKSVFAVTKAMMITLLILSIVSWCHTRPLAFLAPLWELVWPRLLTHSRVSQLHCAGPLELDSFKIRTSCYIRAYRTSKLNMYSPVCRAHSRNNCNWTEPHRRCVSHIITSLTRIFLHKVTELNRASQLRW
jgi:hypothetical protein